MEKDIESYFIIRQSRFYPQFCWYSGHSILIRHPIQRQKAIKALVSLKYYINMSTFQDLNTYIMLPSYNLCSKCKYTGFFLVKQQPKDYHAANLFSRRCGIYGIKVLKYHCGKMRFFSPITLAVILMKSEKRPQEAGPWTVSRGRPEAMRPMPAGAGGGPPTLNQKL